MGTTTPDISDLRRRLGWSQQKMADYLNVTRQAVSDLERGISKKPHGSVIRLLENLEAAADTSP